MKISLPADTHSDISLKGRNPIEKADFKDGFTAVAIIILFATFGFGGLSWWPFFVGAVLVAGLAYKYFYEWRGAS